MKHIESNLKVIKRRIMLRVWYTYFLSLANSPVTAVGIVFGASLVLFFKLVSVSNIILNLMQVRLGALPEYFWRVIVNTVANGDFLKLITLALIIASLIYLRSLLHHTPSYNNRMMQSV